MDTSVTATALGTLVAVRAVGSSEAGTLVIKRTAGSMEAAARSDAIQLVTIAKSNATQLGSDVSRLGSGVIRLATV